MLLRQPTSSLGPSHSLLVHLRSISLQHELPFFRDSQHHKSPYTHAAVALSIIGFFLNFTVPLAWIPALFATITVLMTLCCRVPKKCLWIGVVLALVSSICAFVVLAAVNRSDGANRKVIRIMSILGGLVWMGTTYVIYKIPEHDQAISNSSSSSNGPSSLDEPQV